MTQQQEGSTIPHLDPVTRELRGTDLLPMSDKDGSEPTYKLTLAQLKEFVTANIETSPPIDIPQLTIQCDNNTVYLSWSAINKEFVKYQPVICLFRYRQRRKSKKRNQEEVSIKFVTSARWAHPKHKDSANEGRDTEFVLPPENSVLAVPIVREHWFRAVAVDEEGHYRLIPKGVKTSEGQDIRKNQFLAFAIQITVEDKKYYGILSREVKVGYNRIKAANGQTDKVLEGGEMTDNYIPVIQLL